MKLRKNLKLEEKFNIDRGLIKNLENVDRSGVST